MPVINRTNQFKPPFLLFNGHIQTITASLLRKPPHVDYQRERLTLSDGDFVDLDWIDKHSKKLVVITHGLEGSSARPYVVGAAHTMSEAGYDVISWNCRSCSGEMNKALRLYHHGEIGDIGEVIAHAIAKKGYDEVNLIGYSMGGNITLKYLSENAGQLPKQVNKGVSISAPVDLKAGIRVIEEPRNFLYNKKFHRSLKAKMKIKAELFPGVIDVERLDSVTTWHEFDKYFTCPILGYDTPDDFYYAASSINFAPKLKNHVLLLQAINDPILAPECFPTEFCENHEYLHLEVTQHGGHVGFETNKKGIYYSEQRALEWIRGDKSN